MPLNKINQTKLFIRFSFSFSFFFSFFIYLSIYLFFTIPRSGRLAEIRWSVYISKPQRILHISFSGSCIYHLVVWSNLNFLHNSQWITLPTQSCLVLYSLCANLPHSLIMWLITSSILLRLVYSCFNIVSP